MSNMKTGYNARNAKDGGTSRVLRLKEIYHFTLRLLMSYIYIYIYIYGAPILDVSRSYTTTQHSR